MVRPKPATPARARLCAELNVITGGGAPERVD